MTTADTSPKSILVFLIATELGAGKLKPAPGTWGSAVAVLFAYLLHSVVSFPAFAALTIVLFFVGWWATAEYTKGSDDHDPSEVVIDELAGQWIALWVVSLGGWMAGVPATVMWPGWIAAFVFFRLFDITKPNLVGWADRRGDALGVMLDDVIAGVYAAICTGILAAIFHGLVG
jgi:phosphatidylglycerophosphatase A